MALRSVIVDALAAARLTRLVTRDTITRRIRWWVRTTEHAGRLPLGSGDFVACPWCVGIWAAVAVLAARRFLPRKWRPIAAVLACAEVAGLLAPKPAPPRGVVIRLKGGDE